MLFGYQLKITIKHSKPPIWRRVIVPDGISFKDLDNIIEEIFGWTHNHLFMFSFGNGRPYSSPWTISSEEAAEECIDEWLEEGIKFQYIYDFGDDWIHTINVEKIVEREDRFPVVLKFSGPNMIEDCGGIWRFYDCIDEAEIFDIKKVNETLSSWDYAVSYFSDKTDDPVEDWEKYNEMQRAMCPCPQSLQEIFMSYSKENLNQIARLYNVKYYNKLKKAELAKCLSDKLLDAEHMKKALLACREDELFLFERAINENGITISEYFIKDSLFLCTYTGLSLNYNFLQVPKDVQEKYHEIYTPEFHQELLNKLLIKSYCETSAYLYGVFSKEEFKEICRHYEQTELTDDLLNVVFLELCETGDYVYENGFFMDERLFESGLYEYVLENQKEHPRYFPEEKDRMNIDSCMSGPDFEFFAEYLDKQLRLKKEDCWLVYTDVIEALRMNASDEELFEIFVESGYKINSLKKTKELFDKLKKLGKFIRRWELNGHSYQEIMVMEKTAALQDKKIVPFSKKIYPNDLCPCGSGKKYKHCCGKLRN